jgi:mRNA interferase RelE/StbE
MAVLILEKRVKKFISKLPPKPQKQIAKALLSLTNNSLPHNAKQLSGYNPYIRLAVGEYRIIYKLDESKDHIYVVLIGKRNDGDVYKQFKQILG